jgi:hypothetical protein
LQNSERLQHDNQLCPFAILSRRANRFYAYCGKSILSKRNLCHAVCDQWRFDRQELKSFRDVSKQGHGEGLYCHFRIWHQRLGVLVSPVALSARAYWSLVRVQPLQQGAMPAIMASSPDNFSAAATIGIDIIPTTSGIIAGLALQTSVDPTLLDLAGNETWQDLGTIGAPVTWLGT